MRITRIDQTIDDRGITHLIKMSLRLPNAPMEGLSIDVKKFASDASTFFNRARQYTEEQLGQGTHTYHIYSILYFKQGINIYH